MKNDAGVHTKGELLQLQNIFYIIQAARAPLMSLKTAKTNVSYKMNS